MALVALFRAGHLILCPSRMRDSARNKVEPRSHRAFFSGRPAAIKKRVLSRDYSTWDGRAMGGEGGPREGRRA